MAEQEKNKVVVLDPVTKTVQDLIKSIEQKNQAEIIRVENAEEAMQLARQHQPCMFVACILENGDIPQRVTLLKKLESSLKYGLLKTLIVSKFKNKQLMNLITALGVTDYMEEPVPLRTMQFKTTLQMKAVDTIRKQQAMKKASEEQIVFKKSDAKKEGEGGAGGAKSTPALALEEDTFLFKNSGLKRAGKKVMVEMEGPDPASGDWVPHEDKGDAQTSWRWVPKKEEEAALKPEQEKDGWVHEGEKPVFQEASGKWQFVSEKPELAFEKGGKKVAKKISTAENGEVSVAADSKEAEANVSKSKALAVVRKQKAREALTKAARTEENPGKPGENRLSGDGAEGDKKEGGLNALKKLNPEENGEEGATAALAANQAEAEAAEKKLTALKKISKKQAGKNGGPAGEEEEEESEGKPKKALSPLEFLKKKKEALSAGLPVSQSEEEAAERAELERKGSAEGKERAEREELERKTKEAPERKNSINAAQDALERMKGKLGNGLGESEEEPAGEDLYGKRGEVAEPETTDLQRPLGKEGEEEEKPSLGKDLLEKLKKSTDRRGTDPAKVLAKKEAIKKNKQTTLADIQALLAEPLPEELPPEEEESLRKQLNLEGRDDVSPKDLARKARLEKVKSLKNRLSELDLESEALDEAERREHDLSADDPENTWSAKEHKNEQKKSNLRAFDSDLAEEEEEDPERPELARKRKEKSRKELVDNFQYLPKETIEPIGGSWEATASYHIFLAGEVRYHGFKKLEDLLPLWIFGGEGVPELLDRTQQWRFREVLPSQAKTLAEVPGEVKDFLMGLRKQLANDPEKIRQEIDAAKEAADQAERDKKAVKEGKGKRDLGNLTASLDEESDKLFEEGAEASPEAKAEREESRAAESETSEQERNEAESSTEDTTEGKARREDPVAEAEAEAKRERNESATEEGEDFTAQKKKEPKRDLGALMASLENEQAGLEERGQAAGLEDIFSERDENRSDQAGSTEEESSTGGREWEKEGTAEKLRNESASIDSFLERRKRKKESPRKAAEKAAERTNPFLGIFVSLSNALGPVTDRTKAIGKVLKSMENSFGDCVAYVVSTENPDGSAQVRIAAEIEAGNSVTLADGFHLPIQPLHSSGESAKILGYLFLQPTGKRQAFAPAEEQAAKRVAHSLWAVLTVDQSVVDGNESAA